MSNDLGGLRQIVDVNDRAHFEFVVTAASLAEVQSRSEQAFRLHEISWSGAADLEA